MFCSHDLTRRKLEVLSLLVNRSEKIASTRGLSIPAMDTILRKTYVELDVDPYQRAVTNAFLLRLV